ncbi:MAG: hypothetical protein M3O15_05545, partial [Acidobacteriota bacterium]|nr:hypothetical protein [Acidobacteriota bacterium]
MRLLEQAVSRTDDNALMLCDLSAAYFARAAARKDPADLLLATAAAERATVAAPQRLEPRFNLALGLEKLHLDSAAGYAWRDYKRRDPHSGWGAEAQRRALDLERPNT